jgi:hypothetical protein
MKAPVHLWHDKVYEGVRARDISIILIVGNQRRQASLI